MRILLIFLGLMVLLLPTIGAAQTNEDMTALAYVKNGVVTLADSAGNPLVSPGPQLQQWQSAKLFWSPEGATLYTATRQGLYVTGAEGGAAVRLPGEFGLTVTIARGGGVLYNLDVDNPQSINNTTTAFPLRETNMGAMQGGRGRLLNTIGAYQTGTATAVLSHAAALYARDGGFLEGGRPRLWPTFGGSLFYSCCFPYEGLGLINLGTGEVISNYDPTFIPGPAATNATISRLAGPTTDGRIRVIDLISEGTRDYVLDVNTGPIEHLEWALDDSAIYFISREAVAAPLELRTGIAYPADTRSAELVLWRLNLVTGRTEEIVSLGEAFGAPTIAITKGYVFIVVVGSNSQLVHDLNTGILDANIALNDPLLDQYIPKTVLWRLDLKDNSLFALDEDVWGVSARPR